MECSRCDETICLQEECRNHCVRDCKFCGTDWAYEDNGDSCLTDCLVCHADICSGDRCMAICQKCFEPVCADLSCQGTMCGHDCTKNDDCKEKCVHQCGDGKSCPKVTVCKYCYQCSHCKDPKLANRSMKKCSQCKNSYCCHKTSKGSCVNCVQCKKIFCEFRWMWRQEFFRWMSKLCWVLFLLPSSSALSFYRLVNRSQKAPKKESKESKVKHSKATNSDDKTCGVFLCPFPKTKHCFKCSDMGCPIHNQCTKCMRYVCSQDSLSICSTSRTIVCEECY